MAKRANVINLPIKFHPLLIVVLLMMFLTGNIAMYSVILCALLLHELGHIVAAKMSHLRIESCTLHLYGGEIKLQQQGTYQQKLVVALGGPVATCIGLISCSFLPSLFAEPFFQVQLYLLSVNLLPFLPLDGGKIVCYSLLIIRPKAEIVELYLFGSLLAYSVLFVIALLLLSKALPVLILTILLWMRTFKEWQYRKYSFAYEKIVLKRLT